MHLTAVESGFRNSGITVGRAGKFVSAVRSTHGLEVLFFTKKGKLIKFPGFSHNKMLESKLKKKVF